MEEHLTFGDKQAEYQEILHAKINNLRYMYLLLMYVHVPRLDMYYIYKGRA